MNRNNYGTTHMIHEELPLLAEDEENPEQNSLLQSEQPPSSYHRLFKLNHVLNLLISLICYLFYGFCIFQTFSPIPFMDTNHGLYDRRLSKSNNNCTLGHVSTNAAIGLAVGTVLTVGVLLAIGLTPIGPIAGGLFAGAMGAGIASGSLMAGLQSAVMTGVAYGTGAGIGAATGVGATVANACT
jgi:hypothetical protein